MELEQALPLILVLLSFAGCIFCNLKRGGKYK